MRLAIFAVLMIPALYAEQTASRVKTLILTGESDTQYHDWRVSTPFLLSLLERTGRFDVKVEEQPSGITANTLLPFDLLVLNYMGPRWGTETEHAVEQFVRSGKGLLSFHGVTYGPFYGMKYDGAAERWMPGPDVGWPVYVSLIGASWKPSNIGHGKRHVFPVKWTNRDHPISQGLAQEFLANDELYHRLDLLPTTQVLATAFSDPATGGTGKDEPIIWTAAFGKGRSVHITLGHDLTAMSQPGFVTAFARAAEWAATGQVTLPASIPLFAQQKNAIRVLAVTGGHPYPVSFYTLFEGQDDIIWSHATSPREAFTPDLMSHFDVIVLHDMWEDLDPAAREHLRAFVEAGKGIVSIHHSIVDYTAWPWWWQEVIGGKFFVKEQPGHPASAYKEGVDMVVTRTELGASHPVTRDVPPLVVNDEAYRGMWHSPEIKVLMETAFPLNDRPVVYVGPNPKARVVYIQLGHSDSTMRYPGYRKLVRNAILWGARRLN
jgi:type 1 glutamine amidotransferase